MLELTKLYQDEKWEVRGFAVQFLKWLKYLALPVSSTLSLSLYLCVHAYIWLQTGYETFCGDPDVWNEWGTHKRFDPDHWTCDLRVWIKSMDHIPWRCMDPGNGWGLWTACESRVWIGVWQLERGAGTLYRVLPKPFASCAPSSRYLHLWPQVVSPHYQCQNQMHQCGFQANTFHACPTLQLVASLWPDLITVILINRTEIHHGPTG